MTKGLEFSAPESEGKEITVKIVSSLGTVEEKVTYTDFEDLVEKLRQVVAEHFEGESGEPDVVVKKDSDQVVLGTIRSLEQYLPEIESGQAELIIMMPKPKSASA